jgi:hypothetical protein
LSETKSALEKSIKTYEQDIAALKRICGYDYYMKQYLSAAIVRIKRYIREDEIDLADVNKQLSKFQKRMF